MAAPEPPATADDWIFQPDRNGTGPAPLGPAAAARGGERAAGAPPAPADDWISQPDRNGTGPAPRGAAAAAAGLGSTACAASPAYPAPAGRMARHMAPTVIRASLRRAVLTT